MPLKQKLANLKDCMDNSSIYKLYYDEKLDDNLIYLESRNGLDFTGNILRIAEEVSTGRYGDFKICVYATPETKSKISRLKRNYNLKIDRIITNENKATEILERAKYIFTDSGIRPKYIKKEGQIFVNTWHGTPLKLMGRDNPGEIISIGHIQHSLLSSDYLIYPNRYMMDRMMNAFMFEKIYQGKILLEGYPRNSVFFAKSDLKESLGYSNMEIYVYMPTFRGVVNDRDDIKQKDDIEKYLSVIDDNLDENQLMLVNLHPYNQSQIDFSKLNRVEAFPDGYDVYDIVNMADCLITDYSSVFFDFANTRRKIIIFNYDEEEYLKYRGFYMPLDELPFPKVSAVDELVGELNLDKGYDDSEFINEFCTYDNENAAEHICQHVFKSQKCCTELNIEREGKNILIFAGSLMNNGITSSVINLLENVDRKKYNFFITFKQWDQYIVENHESVFAQFPQDIEFLPLRSNFSPTVREKMDLNKFFTSTDTMECPQSLHALFNRSFVRQFGGVDFDIAIDYDGYNHDMSVIFANAGIKNAVWVHNDMISESKTRNKQNLNLLSYIYSKMDHVNVVSDSLIGPTSKISSRKDNIGVIHNICNYKKIIEDSKCELKLDEDTEIHTCSKDIEDVLSKEGKKFITIGRYSPEKGHERLIRAFNEFCNDYPDTQLIIIGGHGVLYDDTVKLVDEIEYGQNVTLIKGLSNPMPILKECDLFVFPSLYEGWGIVVLEADVLQVPVFSTNVTGTEWIGQYGGKLVDDSQEGILNGMYEYMENGLMPLNIDYDKFNEEIITDFYNLIEN